MHYEINNVFLSFFNQNILKHKIWII